MMIDPQQCEVCGVGFGLLNRQRSCKQCRRRCCAKCIDTNYVSPRKGNTDRNGEDTCVDCVLTEATNHSISVQEELTVTEEINRGLKNELKQRVIAMEKFRSFMAEFCETFDPGSAIFADDANTDLATMERIDSTMPIVNLVDQCQANLHNIRAKVKMMREERNNAVNNERIQKQMVENMQGRLKNITEQRDELQESVRSMNQTILKMEGELEQLADLKRECENLRERCKKMESQREYASGRFSTSSIWGQRNPGEPPESGGSYLMSLFLCPRLGV